MKVTGPMIERGLAEYRANTVYAEPAALVERILRAALNDPAEPEGPIPGQTALDVVDGGTVIVGG